MPSKKPGKSMKVALPSSYKGEQTKGASISPSVDGTSDFIPSSQSEEGSAMKKGKKTFDDILAEALKGAEDAMRLRILQQILQDQVRQKLHAKYGEQISVKEIDDQAARAMRSAMYNLTELKEIPAEYAHVVVPAIKGASIDFD